MTNIHRLSTTRIAANNGPTPLARRLALRTHSLLKRAVDLTLAGIALVLLLPLLPLMALIIRLDSPGPALFSQTRVGQHGREFRCWKLRSMHVHADELKQQLVRDNEMEGGVLFKLKRDPRITRVGRFIRKASIDELPQLWNVFIGDMSLVGPRPAIPSEVADYSPYERCRLSVKPGITCLWQISGRSDLPFEQQVQLDVRYARNPLAAARLEDPRADDPGGTVRPRCLLGADALQRHQLITPREDWSSADRQANAAVRKPVRPQR